MAGLPVAVSNAPRLDDRHISYPVHLNLVLRLVKSFGCFLNLATFGRALVSERFTTFNFLDSLFCATHSCERSFAQSTMLSDQSELRTWNNAFGPAKFARCRSLFACPPQTTRPQTQTLATRTSPSLKCLRAGADTNLFFQMFYCETIFPAPGRNLPFKRNHQDHRGNVSVNIPAMCQSVLPPWLEKITKPNVFLPSACGLPRTNVCSFLTRGLLELRKSTCMYSKIS